MGGLQRSIQFVDETTGRTWFERAGEVPRHVAVVAGQNVYRVVLTVRGNFPVLRFEGARGELLTTVPCPRNALPGQRRP